MTPSREDQVDLAPVLLGGRALPGPVGRVVQLVGDVRGPEAGQVTVEEVALDGLAEAGGAAGGVDLPAGGEDEGAAEGDVGAGAAFEADDTSRSGGAGDAVAADALAAASPFPAASGAGVAAGSLTCSSIRRAFWLMTFRWSTRPSPLSKRS